MRLKRKRLSAQVKTGIWYTICNFFQKGVAFLVVPLYVRVLSTEEYGRWSVFQSWTGILLIFTTLNLYCGFYTKKLVDIQDDNERSRFTSSIQGLGTTVCIFVAILYLCARETIEKVLGLNTILMSMLLLFFIVYPSISFWNTRKRIENKYIQMAAISILIVIAMPAISITLLLFTGMREYALIIGYLGTYIIIGLIVYCIILCQGKCFFDGEYWKQALRFNLPLIPHYLSLLVLNQSDRIMINNISGNGDAGIYSFSYQIASSVNVIFSSINGIRVPWTYQQLKEGAYIRLRRNTSLLVLLVALVVILFSLFSPEIINIMGTEDYKKALYIIPVVLVGIFYTFIYDLYATIEFYYSATKYIMVASVAGAVSNIVLNMIFIKRYGFLAAAYTTLVCYLMFMLFHYTIYRKLTNKKTTYIYDDKFIFLVILIASIFCIISMITFRFTVLRYGIIITFIVCFLKKIDAIKELIIEIRKV